MKNKILITPKSFGKYKAQAFKLLKEKGFEIIENTSGKTLTEEEIVMYAKENVVGIIVGVDPLPESVLAQCKDLKAISKYGVGMDNIDSEAAKELGIAVKNAVGANSISVAELAIALMFSAARTVPQMTQNVKSGSWDRVIGFELTGKTLGLIGGGQIGKEVAKRASGIGMNVTIYDPYFNDPNFLEEYGITYEKEFDHLLEQSDVISLHLPVTESTKEIINGRTLKIMKNSAVLINTARGELVEEKALYRALVQNDIAFAAQDVYSVEPPEQNDSLVALPNFILTPHLGAYTNESVERMVNLSTENLLQLLEESDSN